MISATMAVAAVRSAGNSRAAYAREARLARSAALVVDLLAFGLFTLVVNNVYGVTEVTSTNVAGDMSVTSTTTSVAWPWLTLLGVLYFAVPEAMFGASLGKHGMRLLVVRLDGRPLSIGAVVVRNVLKPIDFLPILYLLGGLLVLATPGAQRLGDLAAGTTVVYERRVGEFGATRSSGPAAKRALVAGVALIMLFTASFEYFARPPLEIDALVKTGRLADMQSYSLGQAQRGAGTVTYPITGNRSDGARCSGTVSLVLAPFGWHQSTTSVTCLS
jgi:uncharacterized RDD family membrane protein YckC